MSAALHRSVPAICTMIVTASLPILMRIRGQKRAQKLVIALVLFCLLAFSSVAARDADIPNLNVEPLCHGIVDQGADPLEAGDPNVPLKQCLESERADKATLQKEWPTFSATNKQHCTDEAVVGGLSTYTDLLTCLEMAKDVDDDRSQQPAGQSSPGRIENKQ
jgi:hypothetical protein